MSALFKLTYGLYILSVGEGDKLNGCVINTASQVTATPVYISIAVSKNNYTCDMIIRKKSFTICPLLQDVSNNLIANFGFSSGVDRNKFEKQNYKLDSQGNPYLVDNVACYLSCKLVNQLDLGTHIMFIGELTESEVFLEDQVLTYEYYQKFKKGKTSKNAPSYHAPEKA
jgi:flavin reductase (DIM6/NTAB) family NADH-FMN oxidoreductase RutF